MVHAAPKLPPLPSFKKVSTSNTSPTQKAPARPVKKRISTKPALKKKANTPRRAARAKGNKSSSVERRVSSAKKQESGAKRTPATSYSPRVTAAKQPDLSAQVGELQAQIAALKALVELPQASPSPLSGFQSQVSASSPFTSNPLPVTAAQQPPTSYPPPVTAAQQLPVTGDSLPVTDAPQPSPLDSGSSASITALSEQIAALRAQLASATSSPATSYSPPVTAAPPLIYELKETRPVGYQSSDFLDSSSEESQDGFFTGLLDQAKQDFASSDWSKLCLIDPAQIGHHPSRASLALFGAVAQIQQGNFARSKSIMRQALQWQCSRSEAARLLIAATHQNLALARSLNHNKESAFNHISSSGAIIDFCKVPSGNLIDSPNYFKSVKCNFKKGSNNRFQLRHNSVILVAGMRHSGSTALFNIIRLALEKSGHNFVSGYSEHDFLSSKVRNSGRIGLIKTHEFRDDVLAMADVIFTTRRDLRDTVASAFRREFSLLKKMGTATEYAKYNRSLYDMWESYSDFEFVYENFINNPLDLVKQVIEFLGLDESHCDSICAEIHNLPKDDYQKTLLTESHITDPEHKKNYADTLSPESVAMINANNYIWLKKHYPHKIFSV